MNKSSLILTLCLLVTNCYAQKYFTTKDIQGVWIMEANITYPNDSETIGNLFHVFFKNQELDIVTNGTFANSTQMSISEFGFCNDLFDYTIDSIRTDGEYFICYNEFDGFQTTVCNIIPRESLYLFYDECSYLEKLPKVAQIVLYENSQKDHRNYAREFLDYDICGVKTDACLMLDSLQHPIGIKIVKDDIVVVRDTCGDFLKVEYEDVPEHIVYGYIKRKDLIFVDEESNTPIVE